MPVVRQRSPRLAILFVCAVATAASAQQPLLPPGEPTSEYATGFGAPRGMAFNLSGDLFVADPGAARIWRVPAGGRTLASFVGFANALNLARDGFGDLLVTTGRDTVYRVAPNGQRSVFALAPQANGITVGPEGDVWVGARTEIIRFSPLGARLRSVALPAGCLGVRSLAMSPTRVLHFVAGGCGVHRLTNGIPDLVIPGPRDLGALAFDAHGWMWVTDTLRNVVLLFDPGYQLRENPFVTAVRGQAGLAFVRTGAGMTPRLLAVHPAGVTGDKIVEMNPRGMGAAGSGIGVDLLVATTTRAAKRDLPYQDTLSVSNGRGTTLWALFEGVLPPGLTLTSSGVIRGTPRASGSYTFSVIAQQGDSLGFGRITLAVNAITAFEIARVLLGLEQFAAAAGQLVDQQGNRNNIVDLGDLRSFLRTQGTLP